MKVKFNKYERVAGLFVLGAVVGALVVTAGVAVKKGWFAAKVEFTTILKSADGLYSGTAVQIAGLRAGTVKQVNLVSAEEVNVRFEVLKKFHERIREDSRVQVVRPFVIGEKVLEISIGSEELDMVQPGEEVASVASLDIMDLLSGRRLSPFLVKMEGVLLNMKTLVDAFADAKRTKAFVKLFDQLEPLTYNLNEMAVGMSKIADAANRRKRIDQIISGVAMVSASLENDPEVVEQIPLLVRNISELTYELKKLTPAINAVAPELPRASRRAIEALDQAVITLKAMQKTFMLRGNVEDVVEEERKQRKPASD